MSVPTVTECPMISIVEREGKREACIGSSVLLGAYRFSSGRVRKMRV
jgi:hypothetical protein